MGRFLFATDIVVWVCGNLLDVLWGGNWSSLPRIHGSTGRDQPNYPETALKERVACSLQVVLISAEFVSTNSKEDEERRLAPGCACGLDGKQHDHQESVTPRTTRGKCLADLIHRDWLCMLFTLGTSFLQTAVTALVKRCVQCPRRLHLLYTIISSSIYGTNLTPNLLHSTKICLGFLACFHKYDSTGRVLHWTIWSLTMIYKFVCLRWVQRAWDFKEDSEISQGDVRLK